MRIVLLLVLVATLLLDVTAGTQEVRFGFLTQLEEKTVKMPLNSDLKVVLDSNPTTGYKWKMQTLDGTNVQEMSAVYQPNKVEPGRVGAGGQQIFQFKAVSAGSAKIIFNYGRPWQKEPISQAVVTIEAE